MSSRKYNSTVRCKEDVVMLESNIVEFTGGETYKASIQYRHIFAINNKGVKHCIKSEMGDEFFSKYFEIVKDNSHKW